MHPVSTENRMVAYLVIPKFYSGSDTLNSNLNDLTHHGHAAKGTAALLLAAYS